MEASEPIRLNVQITDSYAEELEIKSDDDIEEVIESFCNVHRLDEDQRRQLYSTVLDLLEGQSELSEPPLENKYLYSMPSATLNNEGEKIFSIDTFKKNEAGNSDIPSEKLPFESFRNENNNLMQDVQPEPKILLSEPSKLISGVKSQDASIKIFDELNATSDQNLYKGSNVDLPIDNIDVHSHTKIDTNVNNSKLHEGITEGLESRLADNVS